MNFYEGKLTAKNLKIAIVYSKFNSFAGDRLIDGAKNAFLQLEGKEENLDVFKVPGSYETPGVVRKLLEKGYDAIVCLGVIIRGDTPHFEYVASNSSKAIMELSAMGKIPVVYGLITADDLDQAIQRSGAKSGNKGYDAMMTAVEMANLYSQIDKK
ncbi:MAG: 6,7-dimethyl-8-ribityllumazine synthase [Brevinematales bacterium]|nr:6,7-dimethyl-8-ribityllumazine synthase [Brevinematales bacterium]